MQLPTANSLGRTVLNRTLLVLLVAYVLINLSRVVQANYEMNQSIKRLRTEITVLETRIQHLKNAITYYSSTAYRELEAKRRLSLRRPGEVVVLVPENKAELRPPLAVTSSRREGAVQELGPLERARENAASWVEWVRRGGS